MDQQTQTGDPKHEGQRAFRTHGVTGRYRHSYPMDSDERFQFMSGFSEERHRAAERALNESQAYHALTVREGPRDRAWAERLCAERGIQ